MTGGDVVVWIFDSSMSCGRNQEIRFWPSSMLLVRMLRRGHGLAVYFPPARRQVLQSLSAGESITRRRPEPAPAARSRPRRRACTARPSPPPSLPRRAAAALAGRPAGPVVPQPAAPPPGPRQTAGQARRPALSAPPPTPQYHCVRASRRARGCRSRSGWLVRRWWQRRQVGRRRAGRELGCRRTGCRRRSLRQG